MAEAHYNMGIARQLDGQFHESADPLSSEALKPRPALCARELAARSCRCRSSIEHSDEIPCTAGALPGILTVSSARPLSPVPSDRKRALAGVASTTHFFLQYQGQNDLELQRTYGAFLQRVMAASYPQWSQPRHMPPLARG